MPPGSGAPARESHRGGGGCRRFRRADTNSAEAMTAATAQEFGVTIRIASSHGDGEDWLQVRMDSVAGRRGEEKEEREEGE